jgi:hypothetical protein
MKRNKQWLISFTINGNIRIHVSETSSINILYLILFLLLLLVVVVSGVCHVSKEIFPTDAKITIFS